MPPWPTETLLNTILIMFLIGFPIFLLPHSTTYRNYWIYQTIYQANSVKFIIKLYADQNTLLVKRATYQKPESLRVASLSKMNSPVSNSFIFSTKCPEFFIKW